MTKIKTAHIDRISNTPTTTWQNPWRLWVAGLCGWTVAGTFETETKARSAARRKGLTVPAAPHPRATVQQVRAVNRMEVL